MRPKHNKQLEEPVIREAQPEDAEKLIAYLNQIGGESDNLSFGAEGLPITVEGERAYLQRVLEEPRSVMYCAWKDGELVGNGCLSGMTRRMSHRAELSVSVAKKEWNSGIGSMLMEALIRYAGNNGIELLNLEVRRDNARAIHLYEKFGFRRIGTSPAYFKIRGQYVDFDLMYLDLR